MLYRDGVYIKLKGINEGYAVTNYGRVFSLYKKGCTKPSETIQSELKGRPANNEYLRVYLRDKNEDNKLVRDYAKANNKTISDLIRNSVLEKIEDDNDLKLYNQAMKEHEENPQDINFDEMMAELGFDE